MDTPLAPGPGLPSGPTTHSYVGLPTRPRRRRRWAARMGAPTLMRGTDTDAGTDRSGTDLKVARTPADEGDILAGSRMTKTSRAGGAAPRAALRWCGWRRVLLALPLMRSRRSLAPGHRGGRWTAGTLGALSLRRRTPRRSPRPRCPSPSTCSATSPARVPRTSSACTAPGWTGTSAGTWGPRSTTRATRWASSTSVRTISSTGWWPPRMTLDLMGSSPSSIGWSWAWPYPSRTRPPRAAQP